jgi:hypothetical protein
MKNGIARILSNSEAQHENEGKTPEIKVISAEFYSNVIIVELIFGSAFNAYYAQTDSHMNGDPRDIFPLGFPPGFS